MPSSPLSTLALIGNFGTMELVIILAIGLLLFGRRLPEVGKSIGKSIVEFKKGLKGIEEDVETQASPAAAAGRTAQQRINSVPINNLPESDTRRVSRADVVETDGTTPPA